MPKLKIIFVIFWIALVVGMVSKAQAAERESAYDRVMRTGVLRCGVMIWPPVHMKDPNTGEVTGIGPDIFREIAKLIDLKIEFVEMVSGMQVEDLRTGKFDAVCLDAPFVFSMTKYVDYTDPVVYSPAFVFVRQNEQRFKKLEDLNKKDVRFLGIDGDVSVALIKKDFPNAQLATLPMNTDPGQMMLSLATKKADAIVTDWYTVKGYNDNNKDKIVRLPNADPLVVFSVGMSVNKGEQELLNMLNAAIQAGHNVNLYDPIFKKWDPDQNFLIPVNRPYRLK